MNLDQIAAKVAEVPAFYDPVFWAGLGVLGVFMSFVALFGAKSGLVTAIVGLLLGAAWGGFIYPLIA